MKEEPMEEKKCWCGDVFGKCPNAPQEPIEAHETENGWCCACDYDLIELENRIKQAEERERNKILNALRYVVAEDEDGYDTLEEIIKVAGIDNQSKQ